MFTVSVTAFVVAYLPTGLVLPPHFETPLPSKIVWQQCANEPAKLWDFSFPLIVNPNNLGVKLEVKYNHFYLDY